MGTKRYQVVENDGKKSIVDIDDSVHVENAESLSEECVKSGNEGCCYGGCALADACGIVCFADIKTIKEID